MTRSKSHFDFPQNRPSSKSCSGGVLRAILPGFNSCSLRTFTSLPHPYESFIYFVKTPLRKHILSSFISWECCHLNVAISGLEAVCNCLLQYTCTGDTETRREDNTSRTTPEGRGLPWASFELVSDVQGNFVFSACCPHMFDLGIVKAVSVSQGDFLLINGLLTAENEWMQCKTLY